MEIINDGDKGLIIFVDLAKAFDSIDRNLLIAKLRYLGFQGNTLEWFKSYLNGRRQVVSINNTNSTEKTYDYGVVQGSTLGPLLFLIYINNLDKINITGQLYMFADDTAILCKGKTWVEVFLNATHDISIIKKWFDSNILTMNISKTKCLPIVLRRGAEPPADLRVRVHACGDPADTDCACQTIEMVDSYRYLGVIMDSQMRWEKHIITLKGKLRRYIYAFQQLNLILNEKEIKMAYSAYVQSVLQYGIIAYGGAYKSIIEPLNVIQKAIIKVSYRKNRQYSSDLLFKETGLLSVKQIYIKTLLLYLKKENVSILTKTSHHYNTRNARNIGICVPRMVKTINNTNSFYQATVLYRNIPREIRNLQVSVNQYKRLVTAWLVETGIERSEALLTSLYNV